MLLRVLTWNVLHRVHALNWKESTVEQHADEPARIAAITARIGERLAAGVDVVCLQEVSGDHLASLRLLGATDSRVNVVAHRYRRVPSLRDTSVTGVGLADVTEHLVVVVRERASHTVAGVTSKSDGGKGYLAVDVDGVLVVDTHVSFGERGTKQLEALATATRDARRLVIAGDFNAPLLAAKKVLEGARGAAFAAADLSRERPTRRPSPGHHHGKSIDHVLVAGGACTSARVLDGDGLSDHEPVEAVLSFAAD